MNVMAKEMTGRYAEYLHTHDLCERGAKSIYYWVMSSIECFFWSFERVTDIHADMYATENKMFLVLIDRKGTKHEYVHYPTYNTEEGNLVVMLESFMKIFNKTEYPLSDRISSPYFKAFNREKYNGYYHIEINIHMLQD